MPTTPETSTLEPPDYLNEAELAIFKKIREQLDPVKLEVRYRSSRSPSRPVDQPPWALFVSYAALGTTMATCSAHSGARRGVLVVLVSLTPDRSLHGTIRVSARHIGTAGSVGMASHSRFSVT